MSKQLEVELSENFGQFQRKAFIDVVSQRPEATIQDLYMLGEKYELLDVTLGELMGKPGSKKPRKLKKTGENAVDVRTKEKREAYDEAVFGVVRDSEGNYVSAQAVRKSVGGTPLQVRRALNRLVKGEKITFTGRARATRYMIAE